MNNISRISKCLHVLVFCISCFNVDCQLPAYLPTDGLVAWYPFNGNANDESGNGNDGVNSRNYLYGYGASSNFSFSSDNMNQLNSAIELLGEGILFQENALANSDFDNLTLSLHAVVNFSTLINDPSIFSLKIGNDDKKIQLSVAPQGRLRFLKHSAGVPTEAYTTMPNLIQLSKWHIISFSIDGSEIKLKIDGNEVVMFSNIVSVAPFWVSSPYDSYSCIGVGTFNTWSSSLDELSDYLHGNLFGKIAEAAIFNRVLNEQELQLLFEGNPLFNSAPPGIPYQAEVRNENGEVLANANVNVRFTLHELSANGTVSYQETLALTTNELGLFAATIGAGTNTQGTFASINWAQTTKFLQVEVDTGNGYITMGNQQLMSVPYALYAANGPVGPMGPAGADGHHGAPGANGMSAYEIWLAQGNQGSEQEFLNSLSVVNSGYNLNNVIPFSVGASCCNAVPITTITVPPNRWVRIEGTMSRSGNCGTGAADIQLNVVSGSYVNYVNTGLRIGVNGQGATQTGTGVIMFKTLESTTIDISFLLTGAGCGGGTSGLITY